MCDTVTRVFLLILLFFSPAYTDLKNCTDCISYKSCDAAVAGMTVEKDPAFDNLLNNAFCGFDGGRPMVCCSELTAAAGTWLAHAIDNHPNLHLLPTDCGLAEEGFGDRISGGVPVKGLYEYPWMVLISYKTRHGPQFRCGGSLINERYVLAAAHCIANTSELLGVRVGEYNSDTSADCLREPSRCEFKQDIHIEEIIPHPEHHIKLPIVRYDIGLLRLKTPVNLHFRNAGTICLPVTTYLRTRDTDHLSAAVYFWRSSSTENNYGFATMFFAGVNISTVQYCREHYNIKPGDIDEMLNKLCISYPNGTDTCIVSGSPLLVWDQYGDEDRFIQYGIETYRTFHCGLHPEVYTDVTKYILWILNTIKP